MGDEFIPIFELELLVKRGGTTLLLGGYFEFITTSATVQDHPQLDSYAYLDYCMNLLVVCSGIFN